MPDLPLVEVGLLMAKKNQDARSPLLGKWIWQQMSDRLLVEVGSGQSHSCNNLEKAKKNLTFNSYKEKSTKIKKKKSKRRTRRQKERERENISFFSISFFCLITNEWSNCESIYKTNKSNS